MATVLEQKLSLKTKTRLHVHRVSESTLPTVVMVHNMWGTHKTFHRHVKLLNDLGYTCVTFDLFQGSTIRGHNKIPLYRHLNFIYRNWIYQIDDIYDSIEGEKIIFSLSGPSLPALIAAQKRNDIKKYICDGGPFREIWACTYRLFTIESPIPFAPLRALWTTLALLYWGPLSYQHLKKSLSQWNHSIPILSIRGQEDPIVYPKNIHHVFKDHPQINLTIAELDNTHHLDGLKLFPEAYTEIIQRFLADE